MSRAGGSARVEPPFLPIRGEGSMKYAVTIKLVVDSENYHDINSADSVRTLVREMVDGVSDWPESTIIIDVT